MDIPAKMPDAVHLPLDFEAWSELSARLLGRDVDARLDLLAEAELEPVDWNRCDMHWSLALAQDIAAGRLDRAQRHGGRCATELAQRRRPDAAAQPVSLAPGGAAAVASPPRSLIGTSPSVEVPSHLRAAASALPFKSTSSKAVASFSAPGPAPVPHDPTRGETMPLGMSLTAHVEAVLPFASKPGGRPAQPRAPRVSLQTYAALCAELSVAPDRTADILRKYDIRDEASRRAIDEEWRARFEAQPEALAEWRDLCARYRALVLRQAP
ncbi:hypothetical protein WMF37_21430 [Sorangium sp. So ce291]|uniref:hypothetical protein n=1 Tax=Sorangium sp. So ce291 TaxID=3133294 RepID=UPI003F6062B3